MTSLFVSASTTASCTHFIAVSKSTISPLRTPRDGAWPDAENFDRAVGPAFADDDTNFRGANFETDHQLLLAMFA